MPFQTCMTFSSAQKYILKSVGNKTLLVTIDFHWMDKYILCFTDKESLTGLNDTRVSKKKKKKKTLGALSFQDCD